MNPAPDRSTVRAFQFAGVISLLGGLWLLLWYWPGGLPYDSTSGVWTALADDFARGDLYRPVQSELGFGGTRYLPLFFVLHGWLLQAGLAAGTAGMLLTLGSLALLGVIAWRLMRSLGANTALATACVLLLPASIALQLLGIAVKGDLLAAVASAGGLLAAVAWHRDGWRPGLALAWIGFATAILTKFTAVFALAAMLLWLARERRWSAAATLAGGTLVGVGAGLGAAYGFSAGRIIESFAACASGGLNAAHAWKFPGWFVLTAVQDPFSLLLFLAAGILAVRRMRRRGFDLVAAYFLVTAAGTILLFVSPGIDSNHLADLLVASVVLLAVELTQGGTSPACGWGARLFAVMVLATWLPGMPSVRHFLQDRGRPTVAGVREIARRLPPHGTDRILAENPIVPLMLGQRPEVLDAFALRLLAARDSSARDRFMGDLEARRYSAVVLVDWSGVPLVELPAAMARHNSPGAARFYGDVHYPPGFLETLQAHYRLSFRVAPFVVFEPVTPTDP